MSHIKKRREHLGLSQAELGRRANTSQQQIGKLENGDRRITPDWAARLGRALQWTPIQVMFGEYGTAEVPLLGEMMSDETVRPSGNGDFVSVEHPPYEVEGLQAVEVSSEAFEPRFYKGDLLLFPREPAEVDACVGRECLVELEDGRLVIKRVERGSDPSRATLRGYRATIETMADVPVRWATPLRWIKPGG